MSKSQFVVIPSSWPAGSRFLDPLTRSFCTAAGQWRFLIRECSNVPMYVPGSSCSGVTGMQVGTLKGIYLRMGPLFLSLGAFPWGPRINSLVLRQQGPHSSVVDAGRLLRLEVLGPLWPQRHPHSEEALEKVRRAQHLPVL